MGNRLSVVVYGIAGWAICGATVGVGRQFVSMQTTLIIHAAVAPLAFGLLTWNYFRHFPESSAGKVALVMVGIVIVLDALLVAPAFERSYVMFQSIIGTWLPFASIAAASYVTGRACRGVVLTGVPRNAAE